jgi:hypothetical protein
LNRRPAELTADDLAVRAEAGRDSLRHFLFGLPLITVSVIYSYCVTIGTDRLPQQVIRLCLTVLLLLWLYRGSNIARWICILLYWPGGTVMACLVAPAFRMGTLRGVSVLLDALTMLFFVRTLIWSRDVKLYLALRRGDRTAVRKLVDVPD